MKWKVFLGTVVLSVGLCSQSYAHGLLDQLLGTGGGCCEPEPTCCEQAPPSCCEPEPQCCEQEQEQACCEKPSCCKKRCGLLDGLKDLFPCHRCGKKSCCKQEKVCCEKPEPKCCEPEPKCCEQEQVCCHRKKRCCRRNLLDTLFGCRKRCKKRSCCHQAPSCCGGGAAAPAEAAPQEAAPMPPAPMTDSSAAASRRSWVRPASRVVRR